MALALAGERIVEEKTRAHRDAIATRGYGTHYGSESGYSPPSGSGMTMSSCVVWAMECAGAAFNEVGMGATWNTIAQATRAANLKGTVLAQQLVHRAAWTAVYWNPDVAKPADGDGEHPYSARIAQQRRTYYHVPIVGAITNYRPTPGGSTRQDLSGIRRLEQVPFWVGCARGGTHVFCGVRGNVSEFHWTASGSDTNAIEKVPLADYAWLSGVVVIPTGVWQKTG